MNHCLIFLVLYINTSYYFQKEHTWTNWELKLIVFCWRIMITQPSMCTKTAASCCPKCHPKQLHKNSSWGLCMGRTLYWLLFYKYLTAILEHKTASFSNAVYTLLVQNAAKNWVWIHKTSKTDVMTIFPRQQREAFLLSALTWHNNWIVWLSLWSICLVSWHCSSTIISTLFSLLTGWFHSFYPLEELRRPKKKCRQSKEDVLFIWQDVKWDTKWEENCNHWVIIGSATGHPLTGWLQFTNDCTVMWKINVVHRNPRICRSYVI